ncbi:MAG: hypothetical protein WA733_01015, partial [Methylocystis sp.]
GYSNDAHPNYQDLWPGIISASTSRCFCRHQSPRAHSFSASEEFTIRELAEKVIALEGSRSSIEFLPLPEDDPRQRQPDISVALAQLGWRPRIALEEGLAPTIAYFTELAGGAITGAAGAR